MSTDETVGLIMSPYDVVVFDCVAEFKSVSVKLYSKRIHPLVLSILILGWSIPKPRDLKAPAPVTSTG